MEFQRFGDDTKDTYNDEVLLEKLFKYALAVYNELFSDGVWQKSLTNKIKSGFAVIHWKNRCWNCEAEGCNLRICEKPRNDDTISKNKAAWMEENKFTPTGTNRPNGKAKRMKPVPHQWRPPTIEENNKRVIHGNPHTWDGTSSWKKDKSPDSGLEAPGTTTAAAAIAASSVNPAVAAALLSTGQKQLLQLNFLLQ